MTTPVERSDTLPAVAVLGLGEMGTALAEAFLRAGHPTTVWNRTPTRAAELVAQGARQVSTPREAVAAAPLVIVNVKGNTAAGELLASASADLAGRAVVNLTDGTSDEARAVAGRVSARGAGYLHGQIMTIAPGIGQAESVIFYGGSAEVFDRHRRELDLLAGRGTLVSSDAGVPTLYGMVVHGTMWGTLNGFLHGAALLSDAGIEITRFLDHAASSVSALLAGLPSTAAEIDRAEYATPYGALRHHLPSVEDLVRESRARGVDHALPEYTRDLVARALDAGHADDAYSRLVEHFRAG